jgi:hypothetical protein
VGRVALPFELSVGRNHFGVRRVCCHSVRSYA